MATLNKAILIGFLGSDPEISYLDSGTPVCKFQLATSENDKPEWHRVVTFGQLAGLVIKHVSKGNQVYVEGKIQTRHWLDPNGNKRNITEIVADEVLFLGEPKKNEVERSTE
jgi:single-strand DNA-binding protein